MSTPRRNFLKQLSFAGASCMLAQKSFAIPKAADAGRKLTIGIISDLHHLQFGQDEEKRLKGFMDVVVKRSPDFIIQCGDFCRPQGSDGIMREWNRFAGPKYHVLGNHDMDVCSKETIMKLWGMKHRYYSFDEGGFHFVIMDRNMFKKDDGSLAHYDTSNWGPVATTRSFTDAEQIEWLKRDLAGTKNPTIVFMHQPVFVSDFFDEIGNAKEILDIFDDTNFMAVKHGHNGKIAAVFMGHDHDDRYAERNGVHYFILNSATYAYREKAFYYRDPLFAFLHLDPSGRMRLEGTATQFEPKAPDAIVAKFPTTISDHEIRLM